MTPGWQGHMEDLRESLEAECAFLKSTVCRRDTTEGDYTPKAIMP